MGIIHDILLEAKTEQFEKDLKEAYSMGFRDGRLCPEGLRPCEVDGAPAFFHRWADEDKCLLKVNAFTRPDEQEALYRKFTDTGIVSNCCSVVTLRNCFALVEYPGGSVVRVKPELIRFTDRQEDKDGK